MMHRLKSLIKMSRDLRTKVVLLCCALAVVMAIGQGLLSYHLGVSRLEQQAAENLRTRAQLVLNEVSQSYIQLRLEPDQLALKNVLSKQHSAIRIMQDGKLVYQFDGPLKGSQTELRQLRTDGSQRQGSVVQGGQRYLWILVSEPRTNLDVLLLQSTLILNVQKDILGRELLLSSIVVLLLVLTGSIGVGLLFTRQQAEFTRALSYNATHDELTGCLNRSHLFRVINEDIAELSNSAEGSSATLMLVDINRFQEVNDVLGQQCGDLLLQYFSKNIRHLLPQGCQLARSGNDEFALWLKKDGRQGADIMARQLLSHVQHPIKVGGFSLEVGLTIGIALFPEHGTTADALSGRAAIALRTAKQARAPLRYFHLQQDVHTSERLRLGADLRKAMFLKQLILFYQPQIRLADNRICGCEVLVRWQHPELGLLTPARFIDIVEYSGMINEFTQYVLDMALSQCIKWRERGIHMPISVNLSAYNLNDPKLLERILARLQQYQLPPDVLELELTENAALANVDHSVMVFSRLTEAGISLAIDDFGTGMSSLAYVKQLPVDKIKIDKAFITHLDQDKGNQAIVKAILSLCRDLGHKVVAEGIETPAVGRILQQMECDIVQGDFYGEAMSVEEFDLFIQADQQLQGNVQA